MKKIFLILIVLIFNSCKEKTLPSNIANTLDDCEMQTKINREFDSIILNLNESEIKKIKLDSLESIISQMKFNREILNEKESKLEELLKYNADYSDYDEIKNRKILPVLDIRKNYELILNRYSILKK